jgi:hypothetical protein
MNDRPKNPHAVALGQRNKGGKKRITPELAQAMRDRLAVHRVKRWEKKAQGREHAPKNLTNNKTEER